MTQSQPNLDDLIRIFKETLDDLTFSRSEKKAVSQVLDRDYFLTKEQRDILRVKLFELARQRTEGRQNHAVLDWLEIANKLLLHRQDTYVYFSPGDQCRNAIKEQLKQAVSSVDICVFTISDNRISDAVRDCYHRGVPIRIITDDEKTEDFGSDIYKLEKAGIQVRLDHSPYHMHHKYAVFDNQRVITGSYNWTRSAADHNLENILLTDDKRAVQAYKDEFDRLWNSMKPLGA
jgi:mitochondrial cardiolipin hydrolase